VSSRAERTRGGESHDNPTKNRCLATWVVRAIIDHCEHRNILGWQHLRAENGWTR